MTDSFKAMKAGRKSRLADLQTKLEEENRPAFKKKDDRLWFPTKGKDGNGFAVIRFLPAPKTESSCWVRVFSHSFKGPNGDWYIEPCLTTLGKKDPVATYNSKLWDSGSEADIAQARVQKRKTVYYSNVLIVTDKGDPQNEGKVMLFRYGKKIYDKLMAQMTPPEAMVDAGFKAFNPFDFWEGANFNLILKQVSGFNNYDDSTFDKPSILEEDDKALEKIWLQQYSLQEFIAPDVFKSYDELKERLDFVLGTGAKPERKKPSLTELVSDIPKEDQKFDLDEEGDDDDYEKLLAS